MRRTFVRPLLPAALAVLLATAAARAGFTDWSYNWSNAPFTVPATGGTKAGGVNFQLPPSSSLNTPISPVGLTVFTSLQGGNDLYDHAGYSLTFAVTDNPSGQPHPLTVSGEFNGTVTSGLASLSNTFTDGSGSQAFDFLGHHYDVTFGFTGADAAPTAWTGEITASVVVTDPPSQPPPPPAKSPEPAGLVLAALALPALGLAGRRPRGR
jgi:hypothetical protein